MVTGNFTRNAVIKYMDYLIPEELVNADEVHYPASITKILTGLIAVENSQMDEEVTFSNEAVATERGGTSSIARDVGEIMTMEQCLYGMMLESANDNCRMGLIPFC